MSEPVWGVLTRAADEIEKLAERATTAPWNADGYDVTGNGGHHPVAVGMLNPPDCVWIATMSPVVAAPLAEWLRWTAVYARDDQAAASDSGVSTPRFMLAKYGAALAFARLVLGEQGPVRLHDPRGA